ncbi:MAG: NAD(P)H-hydrate dehydratase, partial [Alphaproteobacteria bacterium]|nr:NAD(P)H-hydrate dehydratase [Alphaproteobacteria bacterium]
AYNSWRGETVSFEAVDVSQADLVVDAVFGTGFKGDLKAPVSDVFDRVCSPIVAVDIPSGVNGDSGVADAHALRADYTITFHRKKLGHVLYPGARLCGAVEIADIGITADFEYEALENHPDLWLAALPCKDPGGHKYDSGLAQVFGAPKLTGATRLASEACARIGAGLVSVIAPKGTGDIYRASLAPHILVYDQGDQPERVTARLYGPGGLGVKPDYKSDMPTVLDADALYDLPPHLNPPPQGGEGREGGVLYVLTPHEGEFEKAFPDLVGTKLEKARVAAAQIGAVIVLKGADSVIAHPDGRAVINVHASPYLATAGSGDVLAGMITGLLAQGMPAFEASCASVWMHGDAALRFGPGLVASDLIDMIPEVLSDLLLT